MVFQIQVMGPNANFMVQIPQGAAKMEVQMPGMTTNQEDITSQNRTFWIEKTTDFPNTNLKLK